ncbi:MAG: hypothetical protein JW732_01255 [Dehalococcoidia bacterium]|nr:hypothetical protein [Dehalococcoidia bacterium]
MGKRDFRWREPKKAKKSAKKTKTLSEELMPPTEVEVVKKKKKPATEDWVE